MRKVHAVLLLVAAVAGLSAAASGSATRTTPQHPTADRYMSAPDLAKRIIAGDDTLRVFDLRPAAEFEQMHIPTARHTSSEILMRQPPPPDTTIVLYGEGDSQADRVQSGLSLQGYRHVYILREGLYEWIARVVEPRLGVEASPAERAAFEEAATQSRFFGGVPRADVPRPEVPSGYWTGAAGRSAEAGRQAVAAIRRRGC
jgi:rhodanese-related sulfurtransferase